MDVFKKQVAEWRKQREHARMNFRQLWSDYGEAFCEWWEKGCSNEVRLALILTSKDDILTNSSPDETAIALLSSLIDSLFPEINALIISSQKKEEKKEGEKEEEEEEEIDKVDNEMEVEVEKKEEGEGEGEIIDEKKKEEEEKEDNEEKKEGDDDDDDLFKMDMCEFMKLAFDKRDVETGIFSIASLRDAMEKEDADALLVARGSLILQFCLCVMMMFTSQLNEP